MNSLFTRVLNLRDVSLFFCLRNVAKRPWKNISFFVQYVRESKSQRTSDNSYLIHPETPNQIEFCYSLSSLLRIRIKAAHHIYHSEMARTKRPQKLEEAFLPRPPLEALRAEKGVPKPDVFDGPTGLICLENRRKNRLSSMVSPRSSPRKSMETTQEPTIRPTENR